MSPWARASALDRHINCSATSWLPRADRGQWRQGYLVQGPLTKVPGPVPEDNTTFADWGTAMHLAIEDPSRASDPWRSLVEPHRERLWPDSLGKHEVPFSYDCRTGLIDMWGPLDGDVDRWKESRGPSCVTGTSDWIGHLPAGEGWTDDTKTGWGRPAVVTPQTLLYGLVASRLAGSQTVRLSITWWKRGWEEPERMWQQVGPSTLDAFEEELREAWKRAADGPLPRPGSHCRFCASKTICEAVIGTNKEEENL